MLRPNATPAAVVLAEEHGISIERLLRSCKGPFLSVQAVRDAIDAKAQAAERKANLASVASMDHSQLRAMVKEAGIRNSFEGSTTDYLRSLALKVCRQESIPDQLRTADSLRQCREDEYAKLLDGVTLEGLAATCMPEELWADYQERGWLQTGLRLSRRERRLVALCHRVALCELGVDPADPTTWAHAKHVSGYDSSWGWLRDPGNSLAQVYLATHPRTYRFYVGLVGRLLLRQRERSGAFPPGVNNEREAVRCCVELALQLYNTKLALPSSGEKEASFSHLDCDWKRPGCLATPAPQAFVTTSPQVVNGRRVFSARFVDVEAKVVAWHAEEGERRRREQSAGEPAARSLAASAGGPQRERRRPHAREPYALPRRRKGVSVGCATREPAGTNFEGEHSSGPDGLEPGDIVSSAPTLSR